MCWIRPGALPFEKIEFNALIQRMRTAKQEQKTLGRARQPKATELCSSFFGRAPLRLHSCRALSCAPTETNKAHTDKNATEKLTFHIPVFRVFSGHGSSHNCNLPNNAATFPLDVVFCPHQIIPV